MCLVFSEAHRSNTLKASSIIVASGKRGLRCSITLLTYLSCIFALKVSCWDCVGTQMLKADNPANTSCSELKCSPGCDMRLCIPAIVPERL